MAGAASSVAPVLVICLLSLVLFFHRCRSCEAVEIERTLAMIKPDGLSGNYTEKIKEAILESGFDIIEEAVVQLDVERASLFYAEHADRSFFNSLVKYMTSGPVCAMILESPDAISCWRNLIGPTDARKAKTSHPDRFKPIGARSGGSEPSHVGGFRQGGVFGKSKEQSQASALASIDKLSETLEMLEKKENLLMKKANLEVEKAKAFTKAKNKKAAIQCLKRKRLYEQQVEQLGNFQLRIHDQMIMLEGAKATTETVDALRTGASAMKAMHKSTNIDDVDKTMDEINDNMENMRQIQDLLSAPMGAASDFDEDELEAELADLEGEELEAQLLAPTTSAPMTAPARVPQQSSRPTAQSSKTEDDELAALQAEMAM
ncbi:Vacuolar protein sorting-associated protein 32-like protein 1 [Triticum urartu]|uniref:Vacuolar protein sorting-associated protein 32-like protein 1 n=1 Tax=Triticum urartu TaxID=4572 RepID=M7ZC14_TRIUA|nr:Vacuolar protein sorting-associated protein 32-like protein 1 [Triticum urartu]